MAWHESFGFFMGSLEPPEEPVEIPYDEDAAFEQARDDRAGFNDWGDE